MNRFCVAACIASLAMGGGCEVATTRHANGSESARGNHHDSQLASAAQHSTLFDFGEVSLDRGTVLLEHDFDVWNSSNQTVHISKITTSCGCLSAVVDAKELQPGSKATLHVAIDVSGVGRTTQSATVVFSDGTVTEYALQATGTRASQLFIAPRRARVTAASPTFRVVLQVVNRVGVAEEEAPVVKAGDVLLPCEFDGWTTLEPFNEVTGRPLRQSGSLEVDLSSHAGSFPLVVTISTATGMNIEVTVDSIGD